MRRAHLSAALLASLLASLLTALPAVAADEAAACTDWGRPGKLLHSEDFRGPLTQWVTEFTARTGTAIAARDGRLVIDVDAGATVWLRAPLSGNLLITYKRTVIVAGGRNDRLSDFNHFWMARDPGNTNLFTRNGAFSDYDGLALYYVGIGGNTNTTTRLRKYHGNGERELLAEFDDAAHLLQPNREYAVEIAVYHGCTRLRIDGQTWFTYRDPAPLTDGHFGLRTTQSRHEVRDFKVRALE